MVLIVCILFSFLISALTIDDHAVPQVLSWNGFTETGPLFTFARQTDTTPCLGDQVMVIAPEQDGLPSWREREYSFELTFLSSPAFSLLAAQSFCVPKSDIVEQGYDMSINRYKEVVHEEVDHRPPQANLDELESIEKEITQGMKQLRGMVS